MLDDTGVSPDLDLLLAPGDSAWLVGQGPWRGRDGRWRESQLWVALHRRHGLWTHVYRVLRGPRPGHATVFLERAAAGDAATALRDWAAERLRGSARSDARPPPAGAGQDQGDPA